MFCILSFEPSAIWASLCHLQMFRILEDSQLKSFVNLLAAERDQSFSDSVDQDQTAQNVQSDFESTLSDKEIFPLKELSSIKHYLGF